MIDYKQKLQTERDIDRVGMAMGALGVIGLILLAYSCAIEDKKPVPVFIKAHVTNPAAVEQIKYAAYFRRNGSKTPDELAAAVLKTKSPKLLSVIAVKETRGDHSRRHTGYKQAHSGAWQVNERIHGPVSTDVTEAALQAELVLEKHVKMAGGIVKGLDGYAGDSRGRYSKKVLAELVNVP